VSAARQPPSRPRLAASDALRVVAAVGVVLIHASAWGPGSTYGGVNVITRFSVPAFMLLTGILLAYQYTGRPLGLQFMRRRAARTLIPWLAWVPVFLVFDLLTGTLRATPAAVSYQFGTGFGHLWYLLLIPQMYVVFAFWPRRWSWSIAAGAMAVQTTLCIVRVFTVFPNGWQEQLLLTYGFLLFPFWIGYFGLGVAIGRTLIASSPAPASAPSPGARAVGLVTTVRATLTSDAHPALRAVIISVSSVCIGASGYLLLNLRYAGAHWANSLQGTDSFLNPVLPLLVLSIAVWVFAAAPVVMRRSPAVARSLRFLGDLSLGIYIVHPIFLWLFGRLMVTQIAVGGATSILTFFTLVLAVIAVTVVVVRLLVATPLAATLGSARQRLEGNVPVLAQRA